MFKLEQQPEVLAARMNLADRIDFYKGVVANPLRYYCPNGPQERYINAVAGCTAQTKIPTILCSFANGVGKTTVTEHILLNFIFGAQNGWFDYPIFRNFPFPKLIWYISTTSALRETVQPMFAEIVQGKYHAEKKFEELKDGKTIISRMNFPGGWQIAFKTYEQAESEFESANVGIAVLDEPGPEAIWKAVKSRRRMGCISLLPQTPQDCAPYIFDEIAKAAREKRKGYYFLEASIYEACRKRGIRGHLEPDIVDDMVADYDSDELQARAFGKPMYFSRMIWQGFQRDLHFVEPAEYPIPAHSRILQIVDPHDSRSSAAIWMAVTPTGRKIVFDEYPTDKSMNYWEMKKPLDPDQEVQAWLGIEKSHQEQELYPPAMKIIRVLDRHFGWQTRGKRTFAQLFKDAGDKFGKEFIFQSSYKAPDVNKEIEFGHMQVRKAIKAMEDGKPGLVIWKNCFHTWQGVTHYIRRKLTGKTADDRADSEGVIVEKYKDFPDLIRYGVCEYITVEMPKKPETYTEKIMRQALQKQTNEFSI